MTLQGKVALVTGAGRHIGRSIALKLAREGAAVGLVARTRGDLDHVAQEIAAARGRALPVVADVTVADDVERSIGEVEKALGPVDVLVNNVGVNRLGRIDEMPPDEWWSIVMGNLKGTYQYCRALAPAMSKRQWGRVINVGSRASAEGQLFSTPYCTAKHALVGFSRALALEVAKSQVTVNVIAPGMVGISDAYWSRLAELTGQPKAELRDGSLKRMPQQRELHPDDVAEMAAFLASDAAARITGQVLHVSGGAVMR